jgi:hypothetical protein
MRYAELQISWWRLGEAEPACWTIYENGGCSRYYWDFSLPDGLAWALIYNDGRLNPNTTISVSTDAWQKSLNDPWAGYPKNTFLTSKQHAMQNISGTAWMWYSIHCTNGATDPACSYGSASPALGLSAVSHNFGNQAVNLTSGAYTFTVTNTGTADLHLGALTFSGEFNASNNLCNGQSLAPGGVCTFGVMFTPLSVGAKTGAVSIPSDAASSPDVIALNGNGITQLSASFTSVGGYDGYIIEASETANTGKAVNVANQFLIVGDYVLDRQILSVLHFNTSSLPDNAVITGLTIQIKQGVISGTNPFTTHGDLQIAIASPFFGPEIGLKPTDFQAAAANIGFFNPVPATGNWYSATLNAPAFPLINRTGTTQFRLAFNLDDNEDMYTDAVLFYSGNFRLAAYRPVLIVTYYMP